MVLMCVEKVKERRRREKEKNDENTLSIAQWVKTNEYTKLPLLISHQQILGGHKTDKIKCSFYLIHLSILLQVQII